MKKITSFIFLSTVLYALHAQTDTFPDIKNVQLDVLSTPANPAFVLMETAPTEITEPGTATDFYISVQNASNDFTILPNNFGFTVTPYWWTKAAKSLSFSDDFSTRNKLYLWRYLRISGGILKGIGDNENMWRYGLGIQTNIFSGKVDKAKKEQYMNTLRSYNNRYYTSIQEYFHQDPLYVDLENEQNKLLLKMQAFGNTDTSLVSAYKKAVARKQQVANILSNQFDMMNSFMQDSINANAIFSDLEKRIGFKWDIGAGLACKIKNHKIDSANINRRGVWTNFGWVMPVSKSGSYASILGLIRFLQYEDVVYFGENYVYTEFLGILDFGGQLKCEINNKLSILVEGIYRSYFDDRVKSTYKLNTFLQYKYNKNQLVYFSFGNAFNNSNNHGPEDIQLNIGLNLGFGNDIDINMK